MDIRGKSKKKTKTINGRKPWVTFSRARLTNVWSLETFAGICVTLSLEDLVTISFFFQLQKKRERERNININVTRIFKTDGRETIHDYRKRYD